MRILKQMAKKYLEIRARLTGRRFYCRALQGESLYNLCINSDLSVSCNCKNFHGDGTIGSLRNDSLEAVLTGTKARAFKNSLARGIVPILDCIHCSDLCQAGPADCERAASRFAFPAGIMVENTSLCNLHCLSCKRKEIAKNRVQHSLSLDDITMIARLLQKHRMKRLIYFNLGEPFLSKNLKAELTVIRDHNPDIVIATSTNGLHVDSPENIEAALLLDHIIFSIDGPDQKILTRYQRGGDFGRSYANMKRLVETCNRMGRVKPTVEWKYVLFWWNSRRAHLEKAVRLAQAAGIDKMTFWPTWSPVYGISWKHTLLAGLWRWPGTSRGSHREIDFRK